MTNKFLLLSLLFLFFYGCKKPSTTLPIIRVDSKYNQILSAKYESDAVFYKIPKTSKGFILHINRNYKFVPQKDRDGDANTIEIRYNYRHVYRTKYLPSKSDYTVLFSFFKTPISPKKGDFIILQIGCDKYVSARKANYLKVYWYAEIKVE